MAFATAEGLYVGNVDGTEPLKLVEANFEVSEVYWSPDGQQWIFPCPYFLPLTFRVRELSQGFLRFAPKPVLSLSNG
jgi:hypothetical protein